MATRAEQRDYTRDAEAAFLKGEACYNSKDYRQACDWYREAAEAGNAMAQYNLALMYAQGLGTAQNDKEAVIWYREAAKQGFAQAQYNLGAMYYKGRGIAQDYSRAYFWASLAAAEGKKGADKVRDDMAQLLSPETRERTQSLAVRCFNSKYTDCQEP